jgi:hypothetical protein
MPSKKEAWKQVAINVCFLLSLFFDPEDGNDIFLLNIG